MAEFKSMQEIFNIAALHLLQQKSRSTAEKGNNICLYRDSEGRKCAVGALIPDEEYKTEFDADSNNTSVRSLVANNAEFVKALQAGGVNTGDAAVMEMLIDLQVVHDDASPERWKESLANVTRTWQLEMPA